MDTRATAIATLRAVAEDATADASARVRAAELLLNVQEASAVADKTETQPTPDELELRRRANFRAVVGMSTSGLVPRLGEDR